MGKHPFTLPLCYCYSYKGFFIRGKGRWPAIDRWFEAMEKRDTYMGLRSDFYTHCHDLPPQLGGEARAWADIHVDRRRKVGRLNSVSEDVQSKEVES